MFGFGKKKQVNIKKPEESDIQKEEKATRIDKLVMGAILGVAIGSVLGMTFAPKKGKETRKILFKKSKDLARKGFIRNFLQKRAERKQLQQKKHEIKKIPNEFK